MSFYAEHEGKLVMVKGAMPEYFKNMQKAVAQSRECIECIDESECHNFVQATDENSKEVRIQICKLIFLDE